MFTEICFNVPDEHNKSNSIEISAYRYSRRFFPGGVSFDLVTDVKYMYRMHVLAFALREKDFFSQLLVSRDGNFRTRVGIPISEFGESYIGFQGADKEEEWYTTIV